MSLKQKHGPSAVMVGASESTDSEFARLLTTEGAKLVFVVPAEHLDLLADERGKSGANCVAAIIDLAVPDAARRISMPRADARWGC